MDDYRAVAADFLTFIPALYSPFPVIPALYSVIPALYSPSFPRKRESRGLQPSLLYEIRYR